MFGAIVPEPPWVRGNVGSATVRVQALERLLRAFAATDCLLFGSEEALDDLRQHRVDGERVVGGARHDCELVCGSQ
jgi:hypothetical protein